MTKNKKIGTVLIAGPFIGLMLVLTGWAITSFIIGQLLATPLPSTSSSISNSASATNDVLVYSTPTCPYCDLAKKHLDDKGITYTDIDVVSDADAAREMVKKSGQMNVPVLDVNGHVIVGWNKSAIDDALVSNDVKLSDGDVRSTAARIINVLLGFLGILCVLGIIIGIPIGVLFMMKKENDPNIKYDTRSGKGSSSDVPEEIKGWNWGAAGLPIFWGLYNGVWISLLSFIPILNWFWWIFMGVYGSEWAWRKQQWASVSAFNDSQRKWMPWGIAFFIINVVSWLFYFVSVANTPS